MVIAQPKLMATPKWVVIKQHGMILFNPHVRGMKYTIGNIKMAQACTSVSKETL